jgi:PAS domain S-box-containing protein
MTQNMKILVVDDDRNLQKTLKDILNLKEYSLFQAYSGEDALEISRRENFALIITDLKLPDKIGLDVIRSIKEFSPDSEFIIVTGYASQKTAIQAINAGAFAYFEKPYDINQLLLSIQQVFEKQQTKILLSESQEKYKNLFENATVAMFRTTLDGTKFLEFNPAFCNLLGLSREELFKREPLSLWVNIDSSRQIQKDVYKNGYGRNLLLEIRRGNDEVLNCLATFKVYKQENYIEGSAIDVTEQVHLEKTLIESEERFSLAFKTSPFAITINRLSDRKIIDVNDAFTRILGFTHDEVVNNNSLNLHIWKNPEDREKVFAELDQNYEIVNREFQFRKKSGEIFTGLFSADASMVLNGERHVLASVIDITSWKLAEKAIIESESNFKWLYEKAPIPYHILSTDGRIQDVNQRWCEVLGYSKEDALGKEIFDFIVEDERETARRSFAEKKKSDQKFITGNERNYRTKSGDIRTFKTYDYLVFNLTGQISSIQTTIEDITDRKKAEIESQRNLDRMRSIINILQYSAGSEQEFLDFALNEATKLTQSKIGYIFLYNEDTRQFTLNTWSDAVLKDCKVPNMQTIYDLEKTGLWGEAVRQRKSIIVNDFRKDNPLIKGYPKGHPHLDKYLTVPILNDKKIEAVVGVANKNTDYDEYDALQLSFLMDSVWKVIDRWKAINALQDSENKLRNLINATRDFVVLKDSKFRHLMLNQAALNYFNRPESEILGKTDFELFPKETAELVRKSDLKAIKSGKINITIEKIGDRFFDARKFPVSLGNQVGVGCFIRDVTAQIRNEELIKQKSKEIAFLYELGLGLSQTIDLEMIFQTTYQFLEKLADCPDFTVSLINEEKQVLEIVYSFFEGKSMDVSTIEPLPLNKKARNGRCGAINLAKPIIIDDVQKEKCEFSSRRAAILKLNSALFIPMIVKNKVIGLLEIKSHQKAAYSEDLAEILMTAANQIGLSIDNSRFLQKQKLQTTALNAAANAIVITDPHGAYEWANPAFTSLTGYSLKEILGHTPNQLVKSGVQNPDFYKNLWDTIKKDSVWKGTLVNRRKDGSQYFEEMTITPFMDENNRILHFIGVKQDVTEREQRERELTVVANVSSALRIAETRSEMLPVILDQLIEQLNVEAATLVLLDPATDEMVIELGRGLWANSTGLRIPPGTGLSRKIMDSKRPYLNNGNQKDPAVYFTDKFENCRASAAVPLVIQEKEIGVIFIGSNRELTERDIRLLKSVADIAANAIHRSSLHEKTQEKVNQLDSLRVIDQAINTSLDLKVTLNVVLKQSKELLNCDAIVILLSKPQTMLLEPVANVGFQSKEIERFRLHISDGLAGRSILERRIISADDFQLPAGMSSGNMIFHTEDFKSFHSAPLFVKGDLKGVMLVFYRKPFTPTPEWLNIVNTLATQTAIAIDNNELFDDLQRSTLNLTVAYNETIEGWAKALELRDQETEGHSKRVTDLTVKFAYELGLNDEAIGNIMRGSLLHDIGKMGIPDAILNKPGKLTEEEWTLVRRHPQDAYDMLSPIKYLKPALDIPYCHHERWDGSGYPRGLKGEEIPLAARIFAVVDVWDALTSDRPYRKAWPRSKAKEYMLSQAGIHFDPHIVEVFFRRVLNNF